MPLARHVMSSVSPNFIEGIVTEVRYELTHYGRVWTVNEERRLHWATISPWKKEWRGAFKVLAKQAKVPHFDQVRLEVLHITSAIRESNVADPANCYCTAKSAIDGLVDAQVVDDDKRKYVKYIGFPAPEDGKQEGLKITIIADDGDISPAPPMKPPKLPKKKPKQTKKSRAWG